MANDSRNGTYSRTLDNRDRRVWINT